MFKCWLVYNAGTTFTQIYTIGRILDQQHRESKDVDDHKTIPFWRVVLSVMQGGFGVQHPDNRARDFSYGKILPFIVAALLFASAFVLVLVIIVRAVLG